MSTGFATQMTAQGIDVEIRPADLKDVGKYALLAKAAQEWLRSRGLGQYVPAAHETPAALAARVDSGTLYAVWRDGAAVAFFHLSAAPSPWWPADGVPALYLAGVVVDRALRGQGVGRQIIAWSAAEARRRSCECLRLDCHAGNPWLRHYYEAQGFVLRGELEQHPGYRGCLFERTA
ncbi:MAG: GNAT family N-acetyltransferase [Pirellulales bacterium]